MHLKVTIVAGKFGSVEASGTPTEGQRALYWMWNNTRMNKDINLVFSMFI
jgi:hypothetical protein